MERRALTKLQPKSGSVLKPIDRKTTICLSNGFVMAAPRNGSRVTKYRRTSLLPPNVFRIFLLLAAQVHAKDDRTFSWYATTANDLWVMLGHQGRITYEELSGLISEFLGHVSMVRDVDGLPQGIRWFADGTGCYLEDGVAMVRLKLHDNLLPLVTNLNEKYIKVLAKDVLALGSSYTMRLFILVSQYLGPWHRFEHPPIPMADLVAALDLPDHGLAATEWRVLENDVLKPGRKQIIDKTGVYFEYRPVRLGTRKRGPVMGVEFFNVRRQEQIEDKDENEDDEPEQVGLEESQPTSEKLILRHRIRQFDSDDTERPREPVVDIYSHADPHADDC